MFERFSRDARAAVVEAQSLARSGGARAIDSRHVLLALVDADGPAADALTEVGVDRQRFSATLRADLRSGTLDPDALASVGIDLDAVRERADAVFGQGALERAGRTPLKGHLPFTAEAKKMLELALREAIRLQTTRLDGAMLLLGMLRSTGSDVEKVLRRILTETGSSPGQLRVVLERRSAQAS